ncbi:MAG: DUF1850 domain-containing protein [Deltaproteobacteria bacterium]|nr:DUF1850 domain-containing protein [Deltaproteobacteria bacterium]
MRTAIGSFLVLSLLLLLGAPAAAAGGQPYVLGVYAEDEAAPRLTIPVRVGSSLTVTFLHSYDRANFAEHYTVKGHQGFLLTNMTFRSMLNGEGFELGRYQAHTDGSAELADINQSVPEICFRLGSPDLANHRLIVDGRTYRLLDYLPPLTLLYLKITTGDAPQEQTRVPLLRPQSEETP